jgi:hypothetical protein
MDTENTPTQPVTPSGAGTPSVPGKCPIRWRSRFGMLGGLAFTFFLVKGLLWLTVPAVLAYFATK